MKISPARNASIISAILALVAIVLIYSIIGTVDLVFKSGENEIYRIDDTNVFTDLATPGMEGWTFAYDLGEGEKTFSDSPEFRFEIAKTVLMNLVTFKWEDSDYEIVLNKQ